MNCNERHDASPNAVQSWLEHGDAVLIDIREADEHARTSIPGATLVPLSQFQPAQAPDERAKVAVFHCASGDRTAQAREQLLTCGFARTHQLAGGIAAWQSAGLPTTVNRRAPLAMQPQVQMAAGGLTLLGVALGFVLSPLWFGLSGFVGAGVMRAGLSGWCGMGVLLAKMPWNRHELKTIAPSALGTG